LKYDSTFAKAYTGLAMYIGQAHFKRIFHKEFYDSVRILINFALSFDNQLSEAYT